MTSFDNLIRVNVGFWAELLDATMVFYVKLQSHDMVGKELKEQ